MPRHLWVTMITAAAIAGFIRSGIMSGHDPLLFCTVGSLMLMTAGLCLAYG